MHTEYEPSTFVIIQYPLASSSLSPSEFHFIFRVLLDQLLNNLLQNFMGAKNLTNSWCPNLLFPIFIKLFLPLTQVPQVLFLFPSSHNCSGQFIQIGLLIPYHPYSCIGLQFHFNDYSLHSSLKHNEFCFSMCLSIVPAL